MNLTMEEIAEQALALPAEQRAHLADKLWDSLEDAGYPVVSESWLKEIERRRREVLEGGVKTVPGEEVSRKAWQLAQRQTS